MKKLLFLFVIIIAMISCESPSARSHRINTATEKVVIIDGTGNPVQASNGTAYYTYKVKRIDKGVVSYVTIKGLYEENDTVMVRLVNFQ